MSEFTNNKAASRYEFKTGDNVSFANYTLSGKTLTITHVEVPAALRGNGVGAKVMDAVVEDAREHGLDIIPTCSYAAAYMVAKHKL